jgi:ActR/RegA family two-component response regulator
MDLKILIIDDDKRLLSALKSLAVEENHDVITCETGLDGVRSCREQKFDLVITDLMLPGASGLEIMQEARKISPETLVVLITGYASLESAIRAIREGAYDYVAKPFKLEEIRILIHNASERIHLAHENQRLLRELHAAYAQLQGVKEFMGIENTNSIDPHHPQSSFIAGSMLPLYYQHSGAAATPGFLTDLERISALLEKGFISEEEFELCKSRLLKNHLR